MTCMTRRAALLGLGAVGCSWLVAGRRAAALEPLPAPAGPPTLWLKGAIGVTNGDDAAAFDLAMLEALPQSAIRTAVKWIDGEHEFVGPRITDLLDRVGATGASIRVTALDAYNVEIPVDDLRSNQPILAMTMDGQRMRIRDRGPLCVIYPWSDQPGLRTDRGVWYVSLIEVL